MTDNRMLDNMRRSTEVAKAYHRAPRVHQVKSWPAFFQAIKRGEKTHDLRKDDRGYNVGDQLMLHEYDPFSGAYTGERLCVDITFITDRRTPCAFSSAVLASDYCILSIQKRATHGRHA